MQKSYCLIHFLINIFIRYNMENVQKFFSELSTYIEDDSNYFHNEFEKYPTINSLDIDSLIIYKNIVGNKLLILDKEKYEIYANLILEAIDFYNIQNRINTTFKDNNLFETSEVNEVRVYKNINDIEVNISLIWDYCTLFISLIWEVFQTFGVDLRKIVQEKKENLRGDYSILFIDNTYKHIWELKQVADKVSETNKTILNRQVLTIRTMLKGLGIGYNDLNNTSLTKFIQFILNKEIGRAMQNSYIYEVVRSKNRFKKEKYYNEDCDYVAIEFENIGLQTLATDVLKSKVKF